MHFTCPYCDRDQVLNESQQFTEDGHIDLDLTAHGDIGFQIIAFRCANPKCCQITLFFAVRPQAVLKGSERTLRRWVFSKDSPPIVNQRILPRGTSKPQPEYIPLPIREDYLEACLIKEASPKASATLARRCLQGMIRHFCNIADRTLNIEIRRLREAVENHSASPYVSIESVDAIDAARAIGNIGAHMEKDINVIVDVEPHEAQILIELVETLLRDWYVERHNRQIRYSKLASLREGKDDTKRGSAQSQLD